MRFSTPHPITADHDFSGFCSGDAAIDNWLQERAGEAQTRLTKTFIIEGGNRVVGYYALNVGSVILPATLSDQANLLPAIILGRLAVDRGYQGLGLGAALLKDALLRSLQVRRVMDIRLMLALAVNGQQSFWERYGFEAVPSLPHARFLPITAIINALDEATGDRGSAAALVKTAPPPLPYSAASDNTATGTATDG